MSHGGKTGQAFQALASRFCEDGVELNAAGGPKGRDAAKNRLRPAMEVSPAPFVKWLGGKRQLMSQILPLVPERIETYYEPFVGGGAVFFALVNKGLIKSAVLNDLNPDLISAYRVIQSSVDDLIGLLYTYPVERDFFDEIRNQVPDNDLERAARLLYLTRTSFNGVWRVNSKGKFNVPWGKYVNPRIVNESNLRAVSKSLAGVTLTCQSYAESIKGAKAGDFVYLDPPYVPLTPTSSFTKYTSNGFGIHDHEELAASFFDLQRRGVTALLSNSDTPFVRTLYREATLTSVQARRNVNSKGTHRGPLGELLISHHQGATQSPPRDLAFAAKTLEAIYGNAPWFLGVGRAESNLILYAEKKTPALKTLAVTGWMGFPIDIHIEKHIKASGATHAEQEEG